jgi:Mg2+ and Co2+ transporter CorA
MVNNTLNILRRLLGAWHADAVWLWYSGINFETMKVLALKYNLHPLAIEDALRANNNPRSKIDFYAEHLYTQVSDDPDEYRSERDTMCSF